MAMRPSTTSQKVVSKILPVAATTAVADPVVVGGQEEEEGPPPPLPTSSSKRNIGDEITMDTLRALMTSTKKSNPFPMRRPAPPNVKPRPERKSAQGRDVARQRSPLLQQSRICDAPTAAIQQTPADPFAPRGLLKGGRGGSARSAVSRSSANATPLSSVDGGMIASDPMIESLARSEAGLSSGNNKYSSTNGGKTTLKPRDRYDEGSLSKNPQADQEMLHKMMYRLRNERQKDGIVTLFLDSVCFPTNPNDWISSSRLPQDCWITTTGPSIAQLDALHPLSSTTGNNTLGGGTQGSKLRPDMQLVVGSGEEDAPQGIRRLVFPSEVNPSARPQVAYLAASLDDMLATVPNLHYLADPANWGIVEEREGEERVSLENGGEGGGATTSALSPAVGTNGEALPIDDRPSTAGHPTASGNLDPAAPTECLNAAVGAIETIDIGMSEVVRQVASQCPERASLLDRLRAALVDVAKNACDAVEFLQNQVRSTKITLDVLQADSQEQIKELKLQVDNLSPQLLEYEEKSADLSEKLDQARDEIERHKFSMQLLQDQLKREQTVMEVEDANTALLRATEKQQKEEDGEKVEEGDNGSAPEDGGGPFSAETRRKSNGSASSSRSPSAPQGLPPLVPEAVKQIAGGNSAFSASGPLSPSSALVSPRTGHGSAMLSPEDSAALYGQIIHYLKDLRSLSGAVEGICVPIYGEEAGKIATDPSVNVTVAKGKWKKAILAIGEYEIKLEKWELLVKARESMMAALPKASQSQMEDFNATGDSGSDAGSSSHGGGRPRRASIQLEPIPPKPQLHLDDDHILTQQDLVNVLADTSITIQETVAKLNKLAASHLFLSLSKPPLLPPMSPDEPCQLCYRVEGEIAPGTATGGAGKGKGRRRGSFNVATATAAASVSADDSLFKKESESAGAPKFDFSRALAADPQTAIRNLAVEINRQAEVIGFKEAEAQKLKKEISSLQVKLQDTEDALKRLEAEAATNIAAALGSPTSTLNKDTTAAFSAFEGLDSEARARALNGSSNRIADVSQTVAGIGGVPPVENTITIRVDRGDSQSSSEHPGGSHSSGAFSPKDLGSTANDLRLPNMSPASSSGDAFGEDGDENEEGTGGSPLHRKSKKRDSQGVAGSSKSSVKRRRGKNGPVVVELVINCKCQAEGKSAYPGGGNNILDSVDPYGMLVDRGSSLGTDSSPASAAGSEALKKNLEEGGDGGALHGGGGSFTIPELMWSASNNGQNFDEIADALQRGGSLMNLMPQLADQVGAGRKDSFVIPPVAGHANDGRTLPTTNQSSNGTTTTDAVLFNQNHAQLLEEATMRVASNAKVWGARQDIQRGLGILNRNLPDPTIQYPPLPPQPPASSTTSAPNQTDDMKLMHLAKARALQQQSKRGLMSSASSSSSDRAMGSILKLISQIMKAKLHKDLLLEYEGKTLIPGLRTFILESFFKTQYGTKKLVDQHFSNLVYGLNHFMKRDLRIFTFSKYLTEVYSHHTLRLVSWLSRVLDETVIGPEFGAKDGNHTMVVRQQVGKGSGDSAVHRSDEEDVAATPINLLRILTVIGTSLGRKPYLLALAQELWAVSITVEDSTMRKGMLAAGYGPSVARGGKSGGGAVARSKTNGGSGGNTTNSNDWVDRTKMPIKTLIPADWTPQQESAAWRTVDRAFFLALIACQEEALKLEK